MRLIDIDALIAEYDRVHIGEPGKARKLMEEAPTVDAVVNDDPYIADWRFDEMIENLPASDVAPVRHGRWVSNGIPDSMLSACSVCGFGCGAYSFQYCPNCGARMDGECDAE